MPTGPANTRKNLETAERAFRTIITGGEAHLTKGQDEWLEEQLGRMFEHHYLSSPPSHYVYYDGEKPPEAVNTIHPMPHKLRGNRLRIIRQLGDDQDRVDILGSQIKNKSGNYQYEIPSYVEGFIAPRADIYAAHEMVSILLAKLSAFETGDTENPVLKKPLVISNQNSEREEGYWQSLLSGFGIIEDQAFFAEKLNVHFAPRREEAVQKMKELLPTERASGLPPRPTNGNAFQPGTNLFFHTTTLEKVLMHMEGFRGTSAIIRPLHLTGVIAESPEEKAHTAEGNALLKNMYAQLAAAQVSDETLLSRFGVPRMKSATFVDDTFGYFRDKRILKHFDLTGLEHLVDREEWLAKSYPFPHVEIGPVINACNGAANFSHRVNEAFKKLEQEVARERKELRIQGLLPEVIQEMVPAVDRTMVEGSAIIYQPFPPHRFGMSERDFGTFMKKLSSTEDEQEKHKILEEKIKEMGNPLYVVTGTTRYYFNDKPVPEDVDPSVLETYHFQIPIGLPRGTFKSRAQFIEEGDLSAEPRRKADQALFYELGGDLTRSVRKGFNLGAEPFNILISSPEGPGENARLWSEVVAGLDGEHFYTRSMRKRLSQMEDVETQIVRGADGILVMPDAPAPDDLAAIAEKKFRFWSLIVAKQTDPQDMNKPIVFYDPDGTWKEEIAEYRYLYSLGALKEKPEYIFKVATTEEEVIKHFSEAREHRYPPVRMEKKKEEPMEIPESSRFNVAIFCSASFENEAMQASTFNLAYNLAMSEFGLVYGGGSRYMMGRIFEGAKAAREDGATDAFIAGSNIDHLVLREGKPPEGLSHYYNAPNIYKRMEYMFKTCDCAVFAPGGPGTMQELTGFAMYVANNFEQVKDKEIVIVNRPIQISKGNGEYEEVSYFDLLTRFIPEEKRQALKIHVVNDDGKEPLEKKVKDVVEEIRARSEKAETLTYTRRDNYKDVWSEKVRRPTASSEASTHIRP